MTGRVRNSREQRPRIKALDSAAESRCHCVIECEVKVDTATAPHTDP